MIPEVHLPGEWAEWNITELIGSGSYGTVYKAERRLDDQVIVSAVKVISVPSDEENDRSVLDLMHGDKEKTYEYYYGVVRDFEREIRAMNSLKGITNIVSIEDYYVEKQESRIGWNIYLRMEYLTCFSNFWSNHLLKEEDAIRLGIDISTALTYCEKAQIIHRDIKPENIFVTQYGNYKLGDFGIARKLDQTLGTYTLRGTYRYMAPEIYHNSRYGTTVDQYSLGLVLYSMMNGNRMPFLEEGQQLYTYRDRQKALQRRMDGEKLPPPSDASEEFARIILRACEYKPEDRYPSIDWMQEDLEELRRERRLAAKAKGTGPADPTSQILPSGGGAPDGSRPDAGANEGKAGAEALAESYESGTAGDMYAAGSVSMAGDMSSAENMSMSGGTGMAGSMSMPGDTSMAGSMSMSGEMSAAGGTSMAAGAGNMSSAVGGAAPAVVDTGIYVYFPKPGQEFLRTPGGVPVAVRSSSSLVGSGPKKRAGGYHPGTGRMYSADDRVSGFGRISAAGGISGGRNQGGSVPGGGRDLKGSSIRGSRNPGGSVTGGGSIRDSRNPGGSVTGGGRSRNVDGKPAQDREKNRKNMNRPSLSRYSAGELMAIIIALLMIAAGLIILLYQPQPGRRAEENRIVSEGPGGEENRIVSEGPGGEENLVSYV